MIFQFILSNKTLRNYSLELFLCSTFFTDSNNKRQILSMEFDTLGGNHCTGYIIIIIEMIKTFVSSRDSLLSVRLLTPLVDCTTKNEIICKAHNKQTTKDRNIKRNVDNVTENRVCRKLTNLFLIDLT